ncbi:MAG TPA: sulfite oxidase-like oxidoreductase [Anaerolineales bacterium]|nr:sulfite oxidase-like oxidoreductase [Anaerolineales bacterium]
MANRFISRGFFGKRRQPEAVDRVPPGQYVTPDFPVLSAGPTPRIALDDWTFSIGGLVYEPVAWNWKEFTGLPAQTFTVDIHCVTKWSKLDTRWKGVSLDVLLEYVNLDPKAGFVTATCYGGYTTNLPLSDILNGQAFVAYEYNDRPLPPEHGGPVRLVVPHLYFWKSAKWVNGLRFIEKDQRGFWESLGYHDRGDPWKEERYQGD